MFQVKSRFQQTFIIGLMLLPLALLAQEEQIPSKWRVGLSVTPEVNRLILEQQSYATLETNPKLTFGFSSALSLGYEINDHFTISTGLGYSRKTYAYEFTGIVFGSDIDPQLGIVSESRIEYEVPVNEFQIPLTLQIRPGVDGLYFTGGMEASYQSTSGIEGTTYYRDGTSSNGILSADPMLNFAAVAGIGYGFPISDRLDFALEPVFKYYYKTLLFRAPTPAYSVGLKATISTGFWKK